MLIDHIAKGVDLRSLNVPDFTAGKDGKGMFTGTQIKRLNEAMYIPYQINAINYCEIDDVETNAISSPFSGCLMVAWQMGKKIYVGHVAREDPDKPSESYITWEKTKGEFVRYVEFDPWRLLVNPVNTKTCFGLIAFSNAMNTVTAYSINTETDMKTGIDRTVNQIKKVNLRWINNGNAGTV